MAKQSARSLKDVACDAFSSFFFNKLVFIASSSQGDDATQKIHLVREYFEEQLYEAVKKSVRAKCMEKLINKVTEEVIQGIHSNLDYCIILDGILDVQCLRLEILTPPPSRFSFLQLMSVISHRCPKLYSLDITFGNSNARMILSRSLTVSYYAQLNNLLDLHLFTENPVPNFILEPVLSIIGSTCPKLTSLWLNDFANIGKKLMLNLLIKRDFVEALFPVENEGWCEDSLLEKLRIPTEFLNPLCFTLQQFDVLHKNAHFDYGSEYVFALRHLPALKFWYPEGGPCDLNIPVHLIKTLFRAEEERELHSEIQAAFESEIALHFYDSFKPSKLLSGPLSATFVSNVWIRDLDAVRAVGLMCPHLNNVTFEDINQAEPLPMDFALRLESVLRECWSKLKLEEVYMENLQPSLEEVIRNVFGSSVM